jgi:putative photosynthetic complex assembly protein 2
MIAYALPILATLVLWWASTGVILRLDSRERRTFVGSMLGTVALVVLASWLVAETSTGTSPASAYVAFVCGIVLWGGQLMAFYTGFLTGPNKAPYSADSQRSRFGQAIGTSLYHELAAAAGAILLLALTFGRPNGFALWTYLILWLMHESAKLNVFLGAANLGEGLLPDHLAYLATYMMRKPMNALFPISVSAGTIVACLLFGRAFQADASPFEIAGFTLLGALMSLAVIEHWFLIAPVDATALWRGFKTRPRSDAPELPLCVELERARSREAHLTRDDANRAHYATLA